jgi:putative ABC transport system ATP-binding protein
MTDAVFMGEMQRPPILRVEHVSRRYKDGGVQALRDVNLSVERGDYLAIVGKSGCGKSTLLNLLGSLDRPSSGEVYFDGRPLSQWSDLSEYRRSKVGFIFQSFHLIPVLSALRNVQIPMFGGNRSASERQEKARELLELVGLTERLHHLPAELSGGERQRVAIARALANDPVILLADEPTGNLDTKTAQEVFQLFDQLHRRGMTLVLITHDLSLAQRAQRRVSMLDGEIA